MQYERNDLLEAFIVQRIDQVLRADRDGMEKYYCMQERILKKLDQETRETFEEFHKNLTERAAEEALSIYEAAFLDGLYVGHKAF